MQCCRQADEALIAIDLTEPPRIVLREAGLRILGFILSDMGQRVFRLCVAEADRFPELGRQFYQSGPMAARRALSTYLEAARARGEVAMDDLDLAADQFAELCKADLWPKIVFGLQSSFSDEERARIVDGAVETFLARYGT